MDTSKVTDPRDSNQLTRAYLDSLLVETRSVSYTHLTLPTKA